MLRNKTTLTLSELMGQLEQYTIIADGYTTTGFIKLIQADHLGNFVVLDYSRIDSESAITYAGTSIKDAVEKYNPL
jgi:hypothetical protein